MAEVDGNASYRNYIIDAVYNNDRRNFERIGKNRAYIVCKKYENIYKICENMVYINDTDIYRDNA